MIEQFLRRLTVIYGMPKSDTADAFYQEYRDALSRFSAENLERAADRILQTHKYRSWPTIAECIDAAEKSVPMDVSNLPRPASPMHVMTPDDIQWRAWLDAMDLHGPQGMRDRAEAAGEFTTSKKWPGPGMDGFRQMGPFHKDYSTGERRGVRWADRGQQ